MRHRQHSKRLGRKPKQAKHLLRNLVTSVLLYEKVRTTKKRAKVAQGVIDTVITIGKKERTDLAIRKIAPLVSDKNASKKVLEVYKKRYADRPSGFSRIKPLGARIGDGAQLVEISLIDAHVGIEATPEEVKPQTKKAAPKKKPTKTVQA